MLVRHPNLVLACTLITVGVDLAAQPAKNAVAPIDRRDGEERLIG